MRLAHHYLETWVFFSHQRDRIFCYHIEISRHIYYSWYVLQSWCLSVVITIIYCLEVDIEACRYTRQAEGTAGQYRALHIYLAKLFWLVLCVLTCAISPWSPIEPVELYKLISIAHQLSLKTRHNDRFSFYWRHPLGPSLYGPRGVSSIKGKTGRCALFSGLHNSEVTANCPLLTHLRDIAVRSQWTSTICVRIVTMK